MASSRRLVTIILPWLLSHSVWGQVTEEVLFKEVGTNVRFSPRKFHNTIRTILWKHNDDLAIESAGPYITAYRSFKNRSDLNTMTGALQIRGLMLSHTGWYTVQLNRMDIMGFHLKVISPVPVPTVSTDCEPEGKWRRCALTWEGNTSGAEPVDYRWTHRTAEISAQTQTIIVTVGLDHTNLDGYRCTLENPVSNKTSAATIATPDPFPISTVILAVILAVGLCIVFIVILCHRWKTDLWRQHDEPEDCPVRETTYQPGFGPHKPSGIQMYPEEPCEQQDELSPTRSISHCISDAGSDTGSDTGSWLDHHIMHRLMTDLWRQHDEQKVFPMDQIMLK